MFQRRTKEQNTWSAPVEIAIVRKDKSEKVLRNISSIQNLLMQSRTPTMRLQHEDDESNRRPVDNDRPYICPGARSVPAALDSRNRSLQLSPKHEDFNQLEVKVLDRLFLLATSNDVKSREAFDLKDRIFSIQGRLEYRGFRDDFGPMDLASIHRFLKIVDSELLSIPARRVVMVSDIERRALTNAVFLLGSYLILRLDMSPCDVVQRFESVYEHTCAYRDVCSGKSTFDLELADCWDGLWRAKLCGWVGRGLSTFDVNEYEYYANPLNADLHEIIPGKLIAMRGPKSMPSTQQWDDEEHEDGRVSREFSPEHMIKPLQHFDVRVVVRLNAPEYDKAAFEEAGMGFVDLFFEDCSEPPPSVVAKFLRIAELVPGAIAVHCKSGLGRTGTLIALFMMRHHGFSAREAMGWLRIVRPGSVMGVQQQYLLGREAVMRRTCPAGAAPWRPNHPPRARAAVARSSSSPSAQELVQAALSDVDRLLEAAPRRRWRMSAPASTMGPVPAPGSAPSTPPTVAQPPPFGRCRSEACGSGGGGGACVCREAGPILGAGSG